MRTIVSLALLVLISISVVFAADDMAAFPAAEEGMTRHVINLPKQQDESVFKVEIIIGKTVKTDATNSYFFGGTLETDTIPGWGFNRYILRKLGPMAGTRMAVDPNAAQVERFISIGGEARLLRYNSRVPLVVYVPAGVEVRHRLWRAEPTEHFVQKLALPTGQTAVIAEGDFEARSIGSYSVRIYSIQSVRPDDDTTLFSAGLVRARDGTVEKVFLADLGNDGTPSLVVTVRSVGSGGYLSADAFTIGKSAVILRASVSGLAPNADPVVALKSALPGPEQK
ncbi:MAG TPA: ecotin family protein [Candidatus Binatus sp.]|nr:ecotin family protein [Candidatus Binatus sp.]